MTVRVTVKTHGCPCTVSGAGMDSPVKIDHHQTRTFDISGSGSLSIKEEEPSAEHGNPRPFEGEEVPGRAENDALLGKVETNKTKPASTQRPLKGESSTDSADA